VQSPVWPTALEASPDPVRARHYLELLRATRAGPELKSASPEQARILAALFAGSQALSEQLVAHPAWLAECLAPDRLAHPRRVQGLRREVQAWLRPLLQQRDAPAAFARLREFKQREMLRIAARDLARLGRTLEICDEISTVAEVCLDGLLQVCRQQAVERFGQPFHLDAEECWRPTEFCVLGLGKLGGQELNYSSDIDLMFVYSEEGFTFKQRPSQPLPSGRGLSNHAFFQRLIEMLVAELTRLAPEGSLFRVDLRLRPEGETGPLARSLAGYENYYAQWGQTWERLMLMKARLVAGDAALAFEFVELVQPFRYPRSLAARTVREVADMKDRTEAEIVGHAELDRNVKLGRGGIREIEFIVQTLQLLHAGRIPFLQSAQTVPSLDKLVEYRLMAREDADVLAEAYGFLRDVEHRLQMENNLQTHTIPTERKARERLARLMGFATLKAFEAALRDHTRNVRRVYDALLRPDQPTAESPLPGDFAGHEEAWRRLLANHAFKQVDKSLRVLQTLVEGPGYGHTSPRTLELARQLILRLLRLCPHYEPVAHSEPQNRAGVAPARLPTPHSDRPPKPIGNRRDGRPAPPDVPRRLVLPEHALSDPDRVVARLDTYVSAYGARAMLYEAWTSNPSLFDLLVLLFDRSEFLAETAIRVPDLVDDLAESGQLRRRKTAEQILGDLRHRREDEDQRLWLRRYHQAEFMRLGLRDILGLADFEQNLVELSGLADACLQYALEVVVRNHGLKTPPFAIIGLGKLGGVELTYGSDLDILFVAPDKTKDLPRLQRLAAEVMEMLSSQTELGLAFVIDARLRPDGEKGLLVNMLGAYEEYYRKRAQLWEIQAVSRSRPIAGDLKVGAQFQQLVTVLCNFQKPSQPLAAYRTDWMSEIARMRQRIEKERTPRGQEALAFKTGAGGLVDAEFIAQALCLANGWQEPNTQRALERARECGVLPAADADPLIENYRKLRRIEGILRRWSYEGEVVLPTDPAPLYRVSIRCGFPEAEGFMKAVGECRAAIRDVYRRVFPA
jgi:glutamate-ammonia-ligase adenylyltransferase